MNKFEIRRTALKQLVDGIGRGGIARIAEKIEKDPSYVSRLLYHPDKKGAKNIGEDTCEAIEKHYPNWLPEPAGSKALKSSRQWPFELVSIERFDLLSHAEKCRVQVHMADEIEEILKARQAHKKVA